MKPSRISIFVIFSLFLLYTSAEDLTIYNCSVSIFDPNISKGDSNGYTVYADGCNPRGESFTFPVPGGSCYQFVANSDNDASIGISRYPDPDVRFSYSTYKYLEFIFYVPPHLQSNSKVYVIGSEGMPSKFGTTVYLNDSNFVSDIAGTNGWKLARIDTCYLRVDGSSASGFEFFSIGINRASSYFYISNIYLRGEATSATPVGYDKNMTCNTTNGAATASPNINMLISMILFITLSTILFI